MPQRKKSKRARKGPVPSDANHKPRSSKPPPPPTPDECIRTRVSAEAVAAGNTRGLVSVSAYSRALMFRQMTALFTFMLSARCNMDAELWRLPKKGRREFVEERVRAWNDARVSFGIEVCDY
jgi:hypothetical protein